jgi:hypothetical protein
MRPSGSCLLFLTREYCKAATNCVSHSASTHAPNLLLGCPHCHPPTFTARTSHLANITPWTLIAIPRKEFLPVYLSPDTESIGSFNSLYLQCGLSPSLLLPPFVTQSRDAPPPTRSINIPDYNTCGIPLNSTCSLSIRLNHPGTRAWPLHQQTIAPLSRCHDIMFTNTGLFNSASNPNNLGSNLSTLLNAP